ncbi:hypothetical protein CUN60_04075 [Aquella oligotrophica]|uniref:Uncharacterized protein n=2 Tax=Aquella oligotrophica TaxID=2067065 RepID=A0A2I7N4W7_9NEIS|nr:hypothetical protein CUN60_04075 [Aquella oligotrophica]
MPRRGKHQPIYNWFYWSWNANSGDTGGIVDDSWKNINWNRIDHLSRGVLSGQTVINPSGIGLQPWYINHQLKMMLSLFVMLPVRYQQYRKPAE